MPGELRFGMTFRQGSDWPSIVEHVERYEALGLDTMWIPDHFVFPWQPSSPWLECFSVLAALAARTSRIRLGSLVTHTVYRNPAILARTAMSLDQISGGRLELGLGSGASEYDWTMTSGAAPAPPAERVDRFVETVEIVDGLLRRTLDTYAGRYFSVADAALAPGPVQRPRLLIAASGPRMLKTAARYADAWVTEGAYPELRGTRAGIEDVVRCTRERVELLDDEAAAVGREPRAIARAFLAGFAAGCEAPWASLGAWQEIVGQFLELGFDEFVFPEPDLEDWPVFESVVGGVIPDLRQSRTASTSILRR
jgi:alkanesulfonate monooxygenase SsuD/methylene tetrahydromethanopterin reductase-like flavin-dependent oxidoreductase (luciferase family)